MGASGSSSAWAREVTVAHGHEEWRWGGRRSGAPRARGRLTGGGRWVAGAAGRRLPGEISRSSMGLRIYPYRQAQVAGLTRN